MSNDLISREALKRAIKTECNPYGKPTIDFESGKKVLKIIDNVPTVDTTFREVVAYECGQRSVEERPKGKWYYNYQNGWHCSICNKSVKNMPTVMGEADFNFRPNCRADMRVD